MSAVKHAKHTKHTHTDSQCNHKTMGTEVRIRIQLWIMMQTVIVMSFLQPQLLCTLNTVSRAFRLVLILTLPYVWHPHTSITITRMPPDSFFGANVHPACHLIHSRIPTHAIDSSTIHTMAQLMCARDAQRVIDLPSLLVSSPSDCTTAHFHQLW